MKLWLARITITNKQTLHTFTAKSHKHFQIDRANDADAEAEADARGAEDGILHASH